MSNFCEVCKRPYPDELAACPHCEGAVELADEDVIEIVEEAPEAGPENVPVAQVEPDSAVDLGIPALPSGSKSGQSGEGSGLSVVEWASLVEEGPTPAEPAPVRFDAPSDADLLPAAAPPAQPPVKSDEDALATDLEAVRSIFAGDASASFARGVPTRKSAPPPSDDDDSALNLLAPDEPLPPSAHAQAVEASESGIDLTAADLEEEVVAEAAGEPPAPAPGSGIDLTAADLIVEGPAAEPAASASGSGVDLTKFVEEATPAEAAGAELVDSGIDLDEQDVVGVSETAGAPGAAAPADSGIEIAEVLGPGEAVPEELAAVEVVDSGVLPARRRSSKSLRRTNPSSGRRRGTRPSTWVKRSSWDRAWTLPERPWSRSLFPKRRGSRARLRKGRGRTRRMRSSRTSRGRRWRGASGRRRPTRSI